MRATLCSLALAALAGLAPWAEAQDTPVAFVGARVIPVVGEEIPSGTVIVQHGKVVAVGANVAVLGASIGMLGLLYWFNVFAQSAAVFSRDALSVVVMFVSPFVLLLRGLAQTFNENFLLRANKRGVVFLTDLVLQIEHFIIATPLDFFGDVIGMVIEGFCPGTRAVLENKAVLESTLANQIHALQK